MLAFVLSCASGPESTAAPATRLLWRYQAQKPMRTEVEPPGVSWHLPDQAIRPPNAQRVRQTHPGTQLQCHSLAQARLGDQAEARDSKFPH